MFRKDQAMKYKYLLLTLIILIASCGGSGGNGDAGSGGIPPTAGGLINGIAVPPDPSLPTATISGVDSNANGVRDDSERAIAKSAGTTPTLYIAAMSLSEKLQVSVSNTSAAPAAARAFVAKAACGSIEEVQAATLAAQVTLNNRERQEAAIKAYVDSLDTSDAAAASLALGVLNCNQ